MKKFFLISILFLGVFLAFSVTAATPPAIENIKISTPSVSSYNQAADIIISCRATSVYGISSVSADIFNPNENKSSITLYDDGLHGDGNKNDEVYAGTYSVSANPSSGKYYVTINAVDKNGTSGAKDL